MALVSRTVMSYTDQQKLLQYYQKKIGEGDEQKLDGRSLKDLQEKSLLGCEQVHQARMAIRRVQRTVLSQDERDMNSMVKVYDAARPYEVLFSNDPTEPGTSPADALAAKTVYDNLIKADTFYRNFCCVPPVATKSREISGYVNDLTYLNNAGWDGQCFKFGRSDPALYKSWTDEDIVLHEVGHAVTTYTTDFVYAGQSGALHESVSDVFAIIHKHQSQKTLANAEDADWEFARIVCSNTEHGKYYPLRSLKNPGSAYSNHPVLADTQVKSAKNFIFESDPKPENDFGGVHDYAGIPNHAFYLAATGIGDYSYKTAGKIWWEAIQQCETTDGFEEFARKTISIANDKSQYHSEVANKVQQAWKGVDVNCSYSKSVIKNVGRTYQEWSDSKLFKGVGLGVAGTFLIGGGIYMFLLNKGKNEI